MAIPEKAFADYVYLRNALPFLDEIEFDNLDLGKLKEIVERFPRTTQKLVNAFIVGFAQQGSYTR